MVTCYLLVCIVVFFLVSCLKGKFYLIKIAENEPRLKFGYDYADHIENKPFGEPSLKRRAEKCAKVGADGRKKSNAKRPYFYF